MIYYTWSFTMKRGPGRDYQEKAFTSLKKTISYVNEKWPELNAKLLFKMFHSNQVSIVTTFEDVAAARKWGETTFMEDEGIKQIFDDLKANEREAGTSFIEILPTTFYYVVGSED